jgi:hypothetical protein
VKGSIYETGEAVSVFGTCLDGYDNPVPGSFAYLNSWYPNGTVQYENMSMLEVKSGYFLFLASMAPVQGTYLTEMTCGVANTSLMAKAFGEWQNPFWVKRLENLSNFSVNLSGLESQLSNISMQLGDYNVTMVNNFNTTWSMIQSVNVTLNQTYANLSSLIRWVGGVANASVDRNDSLLALLLLNLTRCGTCANVSGQPVNWTASFDEPHYMRVWNLQVAALGPGNRTLAYPDVLCDFMTPLTSWKPMAPQGDYFMASDFITILGVWTYNVSCYWA